MDCYDPLDPNGNVTVTFDILQWTVDGYVGWTWTKNEVIWSMNGAFATQQGDCSTFTSQIPHSCKIDPVIVDLLPDAANENKSSDCCRGGLLSAWAINPLQSFSSFEITVGHLEGNTTGTYL
ncbi:unnamed protein product [Camellia sinensis]